jgi:hypothetical protein
MRPPRPGPAALTFVLVSVVIVITPVAETVRFRGVSINCRAVDAYSDEAGRGFRFEAGRRSEAKPATIPI